MLKINRYPNTKNNSLQAYSAADMYLLNYFEELNSTKKNLLLIGDRFGFLACNLHHLKPISIVSYKSQEKAIKKNLKHNDLDFSDSVFQYPLDDYPENTDLVLLKLPKSLDLFRLYLYQITKNTELKATVVASFMTKHFSKQLLSIASEFFEEVEQSLAWKKARLLILKTPKKRTSSSLINKVKLEDNNSLSQYFGVFSANNVDYATQFLIENITIKENDHRILDLASGNGIIAYSISQKYKSNNWRQPELHLLDDSFLAVESSKLNLPKENTIFHFDDNLEKQEDNYFNLIISNPPFHFEYEINTEISVSFFKQAHRCLVDGGVFQLVYNRHLPYKHLLRRVFQKVELLSENSKFIVLKCFK